MARELRIGLVTEGTTDERFLKSIVQRTFEEVRFECEKEIDVAEVEILKGVGKDFTEKVLDASLNGWLDFGIDILCVHADADDKTPNASYANRIIPAKKELQVQSEQYCKILVAIVPVQETEAWMLADTTLFRKEVFTKLSEKDLGIQRPPEEIARPKEIIEKALEKSNKEKSKKNTIKISDLYLPIGQAIELEKLDSLPSYQDFKHNIRQAFRELNLLY